MIVFDRKYVCVCVYVFLTCPGSQIYYSDCEKTLRRPDVRVDYKLLCGICRKQKKNIKKKNVKNHGITIIIIITIIIRIHYLLPTRLVDDPISYNIDEKRK